MCTRNCAQVLIHAQVLVEQTRAREFVSVIVCKHNSEYSTRSRVAYRNADILTQTNEPRDDDAKPNRFIASRTRALRVYTEYVHTVYIILYTVNMNAHTCISHTNT